MITIESSFSRWPQQRQKEFLEHLLHEIPVCIRLVWSIKKSTEQEKIEEVKQWLELSQLVAKLLLTVKKRKDHFNSDMLGASLDNWLSEHPPIQELLERAMSYRDANLNKKRRPNPALQPL